MYYILFKKFSFFIESYSIIVLSINEASQLLISSPLLDRWNQNCRSACIHHFSSTKTKVLSTSAQQTFTTQIRSSKLNILHYYLPFVRNEKLCGSCD